MNKDFLQNLKNVQSQNGGINPDRSWVMRNREQLLSSIRQSTADKNEALQKEKENIFSKIADSISEGLHIFVSSKVLSLAKAGMTIFLAGAIAVSSWIVGVSASQDSLPGDIMYNVKMAAETTELIVAGVIGSEEDEVSTILKHASNRVGEYQKSKDSTQAKQAIKSLKKKIESTKKTLNKAEKKSPLKAVAVAKVIEERTGEILNTLVEEKEKKKKSVVIEVEVDQNPSVEENKEVEELKTEVDEVENLINETGINAITVLVQKVESGEVGEEVITKKEVEDTITRKLDKLVLGVSKLDVEIGETSSLVSSSTANDFVLDTVSGTEFTLIEKKSNEDSEKTEVVKEGGTTEAASILEKVEDAELKVEEITQKAEKIIVEVENLFQQNNLSGALEKIKELGDAKNETESVVSKAVDAVDGAVVEIEISDESSSGVSNNEDQDNIKQAVIEIEVANDQSKGTANNQ